MSTYSKNLELLTKNNIYSNEIEHDACGVGLIASTEGKKSREVVNYGIEALKAVWHRGAVDADGKTGDGAGIHLEIPKDFFIEKIEVTGHIHDGSEICVGMIFLHNESSELDVPGNLFRAISRESITRVLSISSFLINFNSPFKKLKSKGAL